MAASRPEVDERTIQENRESKRAKEAQENPKKIESVLVTSRLEVNKQMIQEDREILRFLNI